MNLPMMFMFEGLSIFLNSRFNNLLNLQQNIQILDEYMYHLKRCIMV